VTQFASLILPFPFSDFFGKYPRRRVSVVGEQEPVRESRDGSVPGQVFLEINGCATQQEVTQNLRHSSVEDFK